MKKSEPKYNILKPIPLEERKRLFDVKHLQLEMRRQALLKTIKKYEARQAEIEAKAKRGEMTAKLKKEAKQIAKKLVYYTKYIYVYSGHKKNEALGFVTVFNLGRPLRCEP